MKSPTRPLNVFLIRFRTHSEKSKFQKTQKAYVRDAILLSLDFFESWWIVIYGKNPRKLFPALWISIWALLNVLVNVFWTHSEAILPKLQVIREWSYDALVGLFWKLMDSTFQEKSEKIISGTLDTNLDATECVGWIGFERIRKQFYQNSR